MTMHGSVTGGSKLDGRWATLVVLLLLGTTASVYLPFQTVNGPNFSSLFGLDLLNVFLFQNCPAAEGNFYAASGEACGDPEGRPMLYPPVLYYFFFWAKGMSFPSVLFLWVGLSVLGFGLAGWWMHQFLASSVKANARWFVVVWILLAAQFPTLFSWERASTDGLIFPAAVGAFLLAQRGRWGWVATVLVFLTAYKLYPVFLLVFVAVGLWRKPGFQRFAVAACVVGGLLFLLFLPQHLFYLTEVLPQWANKKAQFTAGLDHVILNTSALVPGAGHLMCLTLIGIGFWLARRAGGSAETFLFGFAVCTFFQRTAFDYSLMTLYPLAVFLMFQANTPGRSQGRAWLLAISWILVFLLLRHASPINAGYGKYALMWLWLSLCGLHLGAVKPSEKPISAV